MEDFVIENNILIGAKKNFELDSYNIGQAILDTLNSEPNHVAQIDAETGRETTFKEMKDYSTRCALWLRQQGTGSGDIIAICTHNDDDTYIPMLAIFYAGATYTAWDENVGLKAVQHLANLLQPKIIFASEETLDIISQAVKLENVNSKIVVIGNKSGFLSLMDITKCQSDDDVRTYIPRDVSPDDIATILFTSGSTGHPKGAVHNYKSVLINILNFGCPGLERSIALCYSSQYWLSGFAYMLEAILKKTVRILHEKFDPDNTSRIIEKYKVEWFFGPPALITLLQKSNVARRYDLSSLRYISLGGSKINSVVLQDFKYSLPNASILLLYGMTEFGRVVTCQTPYPKSNISSGFVGPNVEMKFIDLENGEVLGPNKNGEIHVKTPWSFLGYYKNPQVTEEFIDQEGWLHTGDIGYYNENGDIVIVDRLKEVMKYRGNQISPTEIEELLLSHPDLIEVGVVSIPHNTDGEWPIAFVKKAPGSKITEDELIEMSLELGENKKLRGGVKFLEELPKTTSGKLMRTKLKDMARFLGQN